MRQVRFTLVCVGGGWKGEGVYSLFYQMCLTKASQKYNLQTYFSISVCDAILDIALVIDNSGSIENNTDDNQNYVLLKDFIKSLLDILDIAPNKTRVGAIRFSTHVHTEFKLDSYMDDKEGMKRHIENMQYEGLRTNISGAIKQTRSEIFNINHGDRPNIPNVAIVIADGESNVDEYDTRPQARLLKEENTIVYVVAVRTQKFNKKELEYIASDPDSDHYFVSPTIKNLPTLKCNLLKHVCREARFDECV